MLCRVDPVQDSHKVDQFYLFICIWQHNMTECHRIQSGKGRKDERNAGRREGSKLYRVWICGFWCRLLFFPLYTGDLIQPRSDLDMTWSASSRQLLAFLVTRVSAVRCVGLYVYQADLGWLKPGPFLGEIFLHGWCRNEPCLSCTATWNWAHTHTHTHTVYHSSVCSYRFRSVPTHIGSFYGHFA